MKKITVKVILGIMMLVSGMANAQLTQNFDTWPPADWTIESTSTVTWADYFGSASVEYDFNQNESLISPVFSVPALNLLPTLRFSVALSYYWAVSPNDNYDVLVSISTDGGTTWTQIWDETQLGEFVSFDTYAVAIPMTAYAGETNVKLKFNYVGNDGAQLILDDVSVTGLSVCAASDVPYTQDFSSAIVPNMPDCTNALNEGSGNNWKVADAAEYGFTGKKLKYTYNADNAANAWFFTNAVNLTAGTVYKISYDYGSSGATYPESLKVAYGSSISGAAMTNLIADYPSVENGTPITEGITFTPATSGAYYFGFNAYSEADQFLLFVDNIVIEVNPACSNVTGLVASNVLSTTADLNWTAVSGATGYEYVLNTEATDPTGAGTSIATNSYSASSLAGDTVYYMHVRTDCGGGLLSPWRTVSFTTDPLPPANDDFANAIAVSCGSTYDGDTTLATLDEDDAPDGFGADIDAENVWYSFTGSGTSQTVTLNLCGSDYDTSVLVYTGTSGNLTLVAGNDDDNTCGEDFETRSRVSFTSDGTTTYYIAVEGFDDGYVGEFTMSVTCGDVIPPAVANQNCPTALAVLINDTDVNSDNSYGDVSPEQPTCDLFGSIQDVWFYFDAPSTGTVNVKVAPVTMTSANFSIYSGACGSLTYVDGTCNDDFTEETTESLTGLTNGARYYVQVWSNAAEQGTFTLRLTDPNMATEGFGASAFKAYPNPVKGILNLAYDKTITNVSVYNLLGQEVIAKTIGANQSQIDMSHLASGNYMVKITADDQVKTIKIVKE